MLDVRTLNLGMFQVNCFVLVDETAKQFLIIDSPGVDPVFDSLLDAGYTAKWILLTHAHIDHIAALKTIKEKLDCPIGVHRDDYFLFQHVSGNPFQQMLNAEVPPEPDIFLEEGMTFELGQQSIRVLHTPGHTPGGCSLVVEGTGVFTGDTLFFEGIGRTDLPGGNTTTLLGSIRNKLFALPDETGVFPGHGPKTTIGHEKKYNPFIQ